MLPDLFRRLKPLYGEYIDRLWIAYQLGDEDERRDIDAVLTILAVREQNIGIGNERIVLEPPTPDVSNKGELLLGHIEYPGLVPYPVCMSYRELLRHLFLLGPSGTGKSTFIIGVLRQLLRDRVPFWCIDFKRNYRCLLADEHGQNVLVLGVGRNHAPLQADMLAPPAGVRATEWVEALSDIISTAYLLMQGARNVLTNALLSASNSGGRLRDARDVLATELGKGRGGSRRYGWLESAHRALDELSKDDLGSALGAINPKALSDLLLDPVVFELQGLGDDQKRCVCLYLLQYVLLLRKHQHEQREVLHHVLVFDEAHNVFPKEQWGQLGVPSRLAREVREYGEAIISATQQADIADSLIANSGTKIILRTDYPKDVEFASRLLQIDPKWVSRIPMGTAAVRLPTRYYQSFLITFPEQPVKNTTVPDATVLARYTQWTATTGSTVPAANGEPEPLYASAGSASLDAITDKEERLLRDIATHPISTVTQRYERLSWNPKTGNSVKDRLLKAGMISFEVLGIPNSRVKLLTLTTTGEEYARDHHIPLTSFGRAGLEHEFWRDRLTERCQKRGYTVTREYHLGNNKHVDLHATDGTNTLLIEIETGKSDVAANVRKCVGAQGELIVFFTTKQAADSYTSVLSERGVRAFWPETLAAFHDMLLRIS